MRSKILIYIKNSNTREKRKNNFSILFNKQRNLSVSVDIWSTKLLKIIRLKNISINFWVIIYEKPLNRPRTNIFDRVQQAWALELFSCCGWIRSDLLTRASRSTSTSTSSSTADRGNSSSCASGRFCCRLNAALGGALNLWSKCWSSRRGCRLSLWRLRHKNWLRWWRCRWTTARWARVAS